MVSPVCQQRDVIRVDHNLGHVSGTIFGATLTQEGICSVHQLIEFISKDNS